MFDREMIWNVFSNLQIEQQKDIIETYVLMALKSFVDDFFDDKEC